MSVSRIIRNFEFVAAQFAEQISVFVNVTEGETIFVAENVGSIVELQLVIYACYYCSLIYMYFKKLAVLLHLPIIVSLSNLLT